MTTEPKLPPLPDYPLDAQNWNTSECAALYAYGLQCFEAGRKDALREFSVLMSTAIGIAEIQASINALCDEFGINEA